MAKPRALSKKLDIEEVKHRYYKLGQSLETIGREMGRAAGFGPDGVTGMTVRRQMHRAGLDTRDASGFNTERGKAAAKARWGKNPEDTAKREIVLKLGRENPNWTIAQIAKEAEVSYSWAWSTLRSEGVRVAKGKPGRQNEESDAPESV